MKNLRHLRSPLMWVISLMILGVSCGDDDSPKETVKDLANIVDKPALQKTWGNECAKSDIDMLDASTKEFYQFSGGEFRHVREFYSDEQCQTAVARLQSEGKFDVREDVEGIEDAEEINLEYKQVFMQPLNEDGVKLLDAANFCNIDKWQVNKAEDLTQRSTDFTCPVGDVPRTVYDIFLVKDDRLTFGQRTGNDEPLQPENRPRALNKEESYAKVDNSFEELGQD